MNNRSFFGGGFGLGVGIALGFAIVSALIFYVVKVAYQRRPQKMGMKSISRCRLHWQRLLANGFQSLPNNELWPTNWHLKAAKMIRADLETAKIEPETAEGVINFHSLRVSCCTALARAGVPPTILQKLMRLRPFN